MYIIEPENFTVGISPPVTFHTTLSESCYIYVITFGVLDTDHSFTQVFCSENDKIGDYDLHQTFMDYLHREHHANIADEEWMQKVIEWFDEQNKDSFFSDTKMSDIDFPDMLLEMFDTIGDKPRTAFQLNELYDYIEEKLDMQRLT